jgi:hypothetical protein
MDAMVIAIAAKRPLQDFALLRAGQDSLRGLWAF